ncbi:circadian clock-controlled protein-like [Hyposmocoma kahamanoa]|uniref:circadian clock-controlled protein-like n=1 Tax=Hyposmocoma kahamanoa TaxID=1477025 RepID=UPI000E6D8BF7|nr:circadian clock-controlled protein-like [Hyposmocoma kahamanoa]
MDIKIFSILAGVITFVAYVQGDAGSFFVTPCKAEDSKCLKENVSKGFQAFAKGIPELGVKPLDPIYMKRIDASRQGLKLIATDVYVAGMKNCIAKKASRDVEKGKLFVKFQCDGTLEGQYEMDGQILILPIRGKGPVHVVLRKLVINFECDLSEKVGKDGKKHWDMKKWTHSFELKDKVDLVFENLFDGNEVLGNAARELISSNGKEVVYEIGPPIIKAMMDEFISSTRIFLDNVPIENLALDV